MHIARIRAYQLWEVRFIHWRTAYSFMANSMYAFIKIETMHVFVYITSLDLSRRLTLQLETTYTHDYSAGCVLWCNIVVRLIPISDAYKASMFSNHYIISIQHVEAEVFCEHFPPVYSLSLSFACSCHLSSSSLRFAHKRYFFCLKLALVGFRQTLAAVYWFPKYYSERWVIVKIFNFCHRIVGP